EEATVEQREQLLLHDDRDFAAAVDLVRRPPGEQLLTDERQLYPLHVLERELIAETESRAVDEESIVAGIVLDREVVAEAEQLLPHRVAHRINRPFRRRLDRRERASRGAGSLREGEPAFPGAPSPIGRRGSRGSPTPCAATTAGSLATGPRRCP